MKAVSLGRPIRRETHAPPEENLFLWTVFILLLCGFAVTCWIGTIYIFAHPEIGFAYHILSRLHKLDPPRRFELTAAPSGEFLSPDKLLERYGSMSSSQLSSVSDELLRAYLRNYDHQLAKLPYITGKFTVLDSMPLQQDRFLPSGSVVLAQSVEVPAVLIEQLFPATPENLPAMKHILVTGLGIELRRSYDLCAVIHVSPLPGGRVLFTCVPLLYGPYGTTQSGAGFRLNPPKLVNVKAGLPLMKVPEIQSAEKRYAEFRKATGVEPAFAALTFDKNTAKNGLGTAAPTPFQLVPIARALPVNAIEPEKTVKRPLALVSPSPKASASFEAAVKKAPLVARALPVNSPALAINSPNPTVAPVLTTASSPANDHGSSWPTYRPGQMPRGRLFGVDQASDLADRDLGRDPLYLHGEFVVTAARENRAVLRPKQSLADRMLNRGNTRVIVEVPRGLPTPQEGQEIQRSGERPFQIVNVRHGADGQLNVFVREITSP
jgi:hypothetical protein